MRNIYLFAVLMAIIAISCTVNPPGVTVTSEKTSLEKQLLGSFARTSNDPYTSSAVWIVGSESIAGSEKSTQARAIDPTVIKAQARRRLNVADIDSLKNQGAVGEGIDGMVHFHETDRGLSDSTYRRLALLMVQTENEDRRIILESFFNVKNIVDDDLKEQLIKSFAEVMARRSPGGTPIQRPDGGWEIKPGG